MIDLIELNRYRIHNLVQTYALEVIKMGQPTIIQLLGTGATYNATTNKLEISKAALEAAGISNPATASPIEYLGAIVKTAHDWLVTNTDEEVNSTSRLDTSAPFFRNNVQKTSFTFNLQFFGAYLAPSFDPDDL